MAAVDDPTLLGDLELFQGLSVEQLAELNGLLRSSSIPAGAHFITAEQPGEVVYVLLEGTVKIYVTQADGREVILAFLGRGDIMSGEPSRRKILPASDEFSGNGVTLWRSYGT